MRASRSWDGSRHGPGPRAGLDLHRCCGRRFSLRSPRASRIRALAATALAAYAIGMAGALIRQLMMILRVDSSQPVAEIQRRVEQVRVARIRATQWGVLAGLVVWMPALVVVVEAFWGPGFYRLFGMPWAAANLLFGLALVPLALWISKTFAGRVQTSPFLQKLMRDLAGRNLTAAAGFRTGHRGFRTRIVMASWAAFYPSHPAWRAALSKYRRARVRHR